MRLLALLLVALAVPAASCQSPPPVEAEPSGTSMLRDRGEVADADSGWTDAERRVHEIVAQDGVHVVHFWAPWCHNSMNELRAGLYEIIETHPEVTFTFVTVRNDGEDGHETLDRFGIPERVTVLAEQDRDPLTFLGRPITWTPTTWVFNREGDLAYAFNYGEVSPALLEQAIADAHHHWHD